MKFRQVPHISKFPKTLSLKVARVVNLKLVFTDYFVFKVGSTNQVMQNPIPKLRRTSIISKEPGFLSEKLKTLTSSHYHRV